MGESKPDFAAGVESGNRRKPRLQRSQSHIPSAISPCPDFPDEAGLVQPGLVDIDDSIVLFHKLDADNGELLSLHEKTLGIGVRVQLPGPNEAQTELISQDAADQGLADIGVILLLDGLSYQLHIQVLIVWLCPLPSSLIICSHCFLNFC